MNTHRATSRDRRPTRASPGSYSASTESSDEVATIVFNRAALDDALRTPPRRTDRRRTDRRRQQDQHRAADSATALTPANQGSWLALVVLGLVLVIVMLVITITITWT